jgi:uncharacterized protein
MPVSAAALFDWHARPGAFERLTPEWQPTRVLHRSAPGIGDGTTVEVAVPVLGGLVSQRMRMEHRNLVPGERFQDVQRDGPFARWIHTHRMEPAPDGTSELVDEIDYQLPIGPLGQAVAGWYVEQELAQLFAFRHERTRRDLLRHRQFADQPRHTVAITGGTGLIGTALTAMLRTGGHTVRWITRRPDLARGDIGWDPERRALNPADLEGVTAVVHLAGANVGERWTPAHKRAIVDSRMFGTRTLVSALRGMRTPPAVLVSGSATGYYGDTGAKVLDESAPNGIGFLADVCRAWEAETAPAADAGVRVALARTGIVLSPAGGALPKMLPPFQLGLGGPLGSGEQWMSWISLDDEVGALHHLLMSATAPGAHNLTSPGPVPNREFVRELGRVLSRPAVLPVPGAALRALFGEMAQATILDGQRVQPVRLLADGFEFAHPTLSSALRFELGRQRTDR